MKKIISILIVLITLLVACIPCSAINSGLINNYVAYLPAEDYYDTQSVMLQYRPRFVGTVVASNTTIINDNGSPYYGMNYFPFPTNWYNISDSYQEEYAIPVQPIITTATTLSQKNVTLLESTTNDVIHMALGSNVGTIGTSAPDLYFDGLLGLYNDGSFSIYVENLGEIDIYIGFDGDLYLDHGTKYEVHEFEEAFVLGSDTSTTASLDTLIRQKVYNYYDTNCDMYFKGLFYIICNYPGDIEEGYGYCYNLSIAGDADVTTVVNGEITSSNSQAINVLDKFTKMLYLSQDNASAAIVPNGSLVIRDNGTYDISKYAQVRVDVPREVVTLEDTNMFSWLISVASGFLRFEIAPNFTIGGILVLCVGFALIFWLIKIFLGG